MTRKQAEKYADAIRLVATRDKSAWTTTSITTMDVAAVLKKRDSEVAEAIATGGSAIWGCMPVGWGFSRRGFTGITVSRPASGV